MMGNIDAIIEHVRKYCDDRGIPFPEVTTDDTVVTMVFEKEN